MQQVVRSAVQRRRRHDVVAGLAQREECERLGGLAGRDGERARDADRRGATTFERAQASLERTLGGVHDPGVDVADLGQTEQVRGVLGVAELERRRLVDGNGACPSCRVRFAADVDLLGLETPVVTHPHDTRPRIPTRQLGFYRNVRAGRGLAPRRAHRPIRRPWHRSSPG